LELKGDNKHMNGRERVLRSIEFRHPDHLPLRYAHLPDISDSIGLGADPPRDWQPPATTPDGRILRPSDGHRPKSTTEPLGWGIDEWGCLWEDHEITGLGQMKQAPLQSWDALDTYVFPDPEAPGRFDRARAVAARYPDRFLAGSIGLMGFNRLFFLRGFENLMVDLLAEPEKIGALADRVFDYMMGIASGFARVGVQAVGFGDDLGTEQGTMISPALFRSFFKPRFAAFCAHAHKLGMHTELHSCGNVWEIIPDLIECGFDVLNLEQPRVFGLKRLGAAFAGKVCFLTNPDSQTTLPVASPHAVAAETIELVRALTTDAGGLIANADCTWNHGYTPKDNLAAMAETFEALRRRPWGDWQADITKWPDTVPGAEKTNGLS
jgi:uroporphyrinogen decarboxylase